MKTFGIIGSAGRGEDIAKITEETFFIMRASVRKIIQSLLVPNEQYAVVSGGAAWADHVAVSLFNRGEASKLILHLPCKFDCDYVSFVHRPEDSGNIVFTANHYHTIFSNIAFPSADGYADDFASRKQIVEAIEKGAKTTVSNGFFARNVLVARDAEYMIALTFGKNEKLKDGGTKHTMGLFLMKNDPLRSYHVDLNNWGCFNPAKV